MAEGEPPFCNIHPMRAIFVIPNREPATLKNQVREAQPAGELLQTAVVIRVFLSPGPVVK